MWLVFHVVLGLASAFSPLPVIIWFYLVAISSILWVLQSTRSPAPLILYTVYLTSFELLARMASSSPFIPYELGKYLLFLLLVFGIFTFQKKSWIGFVMLFLLIPALIIDESGRVEWLDLVFNVLGPINVALAVWFFYQKRVSVKVLGYSLLLAVLPLVSVLSFTIYRVPDFDDVDFELGANTLASAGFGSNQVSTALGLGAFLAFVIWLNKWRLSGIRWLDALIFLAFCVQGLLTFSRGGMFGTVVGVVVVLFFLSKSTGIQIRKYNLPKIGKFVIPAILLIVVSFYVANELTRGMLLLRYQGETAGTLAGAKEKDLNTYTTGRLDIFTGDLEIWENHILLGVGAGASRYLRNTMEEVAAHIELSRLLAEHGLLGLMYFILLCYVGFINYRKHKNPMIRGLLLAFFLVGIYTSFHAAMRTFISPLMIGLSLLQIVQLKKKKPVKKVSSEEKPRPVLNLL
ncbi:O-antigen ligase family protein [Mongoliibacter sp.]|uniref:O-antigen ligase family protein n=1 Tax=Mongoliibacter sp. TaxID=2022438 RepID=UPI0025FAD586|nr:O-antigen ligase family protein [Mongoliibacter sp.]